MTGASPDAMHAMTPAQSILSISLVMTRARSPSSVCAADTPNMTFAATPGRKTFVIDPCARVAKNKTPTFDSSGTPSDNADAICVDVHSSGDDEFTHVGLAFFFVERFVSYVARH